jgi:hypothetical protein
LILQYGPGACQCQVSRLNTPQYSFLP